MEEFALVPHPCADREFADYVEPVADHNFARKKMLTLEQGIGKLQKDARQQHESVLQLGSDMKAMVSEMDLRRAIGLAFQEFEVRLEDVFQDSNRKCVAMFSKREEVMELQGLIGKKVNWTDYNAVLRKLSELRQYIDTMAESVFIGHRDALNSEFAKKADAVTVDQALKAKADFGEVSEVRARLERLEVLVSHTDARHSQQLEELRADSRREQGKKAEEQQTIISANRAAVESLRAGQLSLANRLESAEGDVSALQETGRRIMEIEQIIKNRQQSIESTMATMQDQLTHVDDGVERNQQDLRSLAVETEEHRTASGQKFKELSSQGDSFRERLDFLMQATEMMKRKSRETNKTNTGKFSDLSDDQEKQSNQLSAIERVTKKTERDLRALEHRVNKADGAGGGFSSLRALPAGLGDVMGGEPSVDGPNERLKGILDQLEKIGACGHPFEQMGVEINPSRPPLPWYGDDGEGMAALPRFAGHAGPAPIDSARGPPAATTSAMRGMLPSPRQAPVVGAKTPRKKR